MDSRRPRRAAVPSPAMIALISGLAALIFQAMAVVGAGVRVSLK